MGTERIERIIRDFDTRKLGEDEEPIGLSSSLCEMMVSIFHLCHNNGIDLWDIVRAANVHFEYDKNEKEREQNESNG